MGEALGAAAACSSQCQLHRLHGELGVGLGPWAVAEAVKGACEELLEWMETAGCELLGGMG